MTTYCEANYKTKKALKEAVKSGDTVRVHTMTPMGSKTPDNGKTCVCGPHYPEPHRWYATVAVEDGVITKVVS